MGKIRLDPWRRYKVFTQTRRMVKHETEHIEQIATRMWGYTPCDRRYNRAMNPAMWHRVEAGLLPSVLF
jgi:hypothetical protein